MEYIDGERLSGPMPVKEALHVAGRSPSALEAAHETLRRDPRHRGVYGSGAARGREVDKRADIWAFGVLLHELLTGRCLFDGEDLTGTLAMVLKEQPDLSDAPAEVRPLLARRPTNDHLRAQHGASVRIKSRSDPARRSRRSGVDT